MTDKPSATHGETKTDNAFPPGRAALISLAIVAFILIFRPFGASVTSFVSLLAVAGLAPLNFLLMLGVHQIRFVTGIARAGFSIAVITGANVLYISQFGDGGVINTGINVILVSGLVVAGVFLWNRQRSLQEQIISLTHAASRKSDDLIVLSSEDNKEILRLSPEDLYWIKASGNYVEVRFNKSGVPANALLRSTLANMLEHAPEDVLHQCHRSYLVNVNAAQRMVKNARLMRLEFPDGSAAPVSRQYRNHIIARAKPA